MTNIEQPRISDGTFTHKTQSHPGVSLAGTDAPVGYTYRAENFTPKDTISAMVQHGELSPAALDMDPEEVLAQHAAANAIDREDLHSFDSDEFPKPVYSDQLECSDSEWTSDAPNHNADEYGTCTTCGAQVHDYDDDDDDDGDIGDTVCILTGAPGENEDDCTTHEHENQE